MVKTIGLECFTCNSIAFDGKCLCGNCGILSKSDHYIMFSNTKSVNVVNVYLNNGQIVGFTHVSQPDFFEWNFHDSKNHTNLLQL